MKYLRLYRCMFKMNLKVMIQYRADFFIGSLSTLLMQVSSIVFLWAIFNNIEDFAGWSFEEVVFSYGIFTVCRGLNHIFFDNLWIIGREFIRKGTFDLMLIRPSNTLFQIIGQKIQPDGVGTFVLGIAVIVGAYRGMSFTVGAMDVLFLIVFIILGTIIIATINLIFSVSSFWTVRSNNIMWMVFSLADFAQYPLLIYHPIIKFILSWVIPYGFVSYYPISFLLRKSSVNVLFYEIALMLVLLFIANRLWKFGLSRYESTGS